MHIAHQKLFSHLGNDGAIVVIQTSYANLSPNQERTHHTKYPIFFYPLEEIKHLKGEQFLSLLYEEFPLLEKIVVGFDFHFGHNAACNITTLRKIFNGVVIVVDEFKLNNIAVHSRVIRDHLKNGKIQQANNMLGYNYKIKGNHIKGQGLGLKSFVPTINIAINDYLLPKNGVYITKTIINTIPYHSITFIGHRETTDGNFAVETHILTDISNIETPHIVDIEFYKLIRENSKFDSFDKLKDQILKDIAIAKSYFE